MFLPFPCFLPLFHQKEYLMPAFHCQGGGYFTAGCSFYIEVEVGVMAQVEIRAYAEFPPAAAEVMVVAVGSTVFVHVHIHVAFEVVEVGGADINVAGFYVFTESKSQTAYEAVKAVLMDVYTFSGGEVGRVYTAIGKFCLRFDPEVILHFEAFAVFSTECEAIGAVVAVTGAGVSVIFVFHVGVLGNDVDEAAVIGQAAAVYSEAGVFVCAVAIAEAAFPIGVGNGAAEDPVIGNSGIVA